MVYKPREMFVYNYAVTLVPSLFFHQDKLQLRIPMYPLIL